MACATTGLPSDAIPDAGTLPPAEPSLPSTWSRTEVEASGTSVLAIRSNTAAPNCPVPELSSTSIRAGGAAPRLVPKVAMRCEKSVGTTKPPYTSKSRMACSSAARVR